MASGKPAPKRKVPTIYIGQPGEARVRAARLMMFNQWIADALERG